MQMMKKISLLFLTLLFLAGCQTNHVADNTASDVNGVKDWFAAEEPNYDIVDINAVKDGVYILLTTFTPPGVAEDSYTMVRAYVVSISDDGYGIETLEDAYGPGSIGFSAELLSTDEVTVLFGDLGSAVYDFTADAIKNVSFSEVIAKLSDGEEISTPVKNNTPYIIVMDAGIEISDVIFRTENEDILYSDCYNESLEESARE